MRKHKCCLIESTTSNPSAQLSGMKLAVPFNVHTLSSSQQKPFDACDTETLLSAMYQISITQTCADMGEQQVLLNLVHQPSECSDFSGHLQAKAQNDMQGNLIQVPRERCDLPSRASRFPAEALPKSCGTGPRSVPLESQRRERVSRSYLSASRHLPKQRHQCWVAGGVLAAAGKRKEALKEGRRGRDTEHSLLVAGVQNQQSRSKTKAKTAAQACKTSKTRWIYIKSKDLLFI